MLYPLSYGRDERAVYPGDGGAALVGPAAVACG
jgi:hypothetical protein